MKNYWVLFLITSACLSCSPNIQSEDDRPNIIVIIADDAGYIDFGFMGSPDLKTPELDKLASRGVIFTDAHTSASVCAPSRAGLITGKYQQRFGFECNAIPQGMGLDLKQSTMGDALQSAGYKTIAIGKWHLGNGPSYHPNERGFDEFYGFLAGARSYFYNKNEDKKGSPKAILQNKQRVDFSGYLTDVFGNKAVEYIDLYKKEPFFMYLSFNAVHTPMEAKVEDLEKFKGHSRQELAAMTWSMDQNIGKLVHKLEKEELLNNTLIFFLSDNGGATNNQSDCGPLKGWKGNKFEGGHRVPFVLSWPAQIKPGSTFNGLTSSLDIFATIDAVAKTEQSGLDGVNLIPYLSGEKQGNPHPSLFWRKDKMAALRKGQFKLVRLEDYGYRYYNLAEDIGETTSLETIMPDGFSNSKEDLELWERDLVSPSWLEEETWNQVTYEIHQALMENRTPNYVNPRQMTRYRKRTKK